MLHCVCSKGFVSKPVVTDQYSIKRLELFLKSTVLVAIRYQMFPSVTPSLGHRASVRQLFIHEVTWKGSGTTVAVGGKIACRLSTRFICFKNSLLRKEYMIGLQTVLA